MYAFLWNIIGVLHLMAHRGHIRSIGGRSPGRQNLATADPQGRSPFSNSMQSVKFHRQLNIMTSFLLYSLSYV